MHLADGVLSLPVVALTSGAAVGLVAYSIRGITEEEVPQISLLTGAFFALSLLSIPIGPTSVHPLLGGLLGIILGKRASLAFFIGLLLQALLFQHGGLTTLGANTLSFALPALVVHRLFYHMERRSVFWRGALAGGLAIIGTALLVVVCLLATDPRFGGGLFSVVNVLVMAHLPLIFIEGLLTGSAIRFLHTTRPEIFSASKSES